MPAKVSLIPSDISNNKRKGKETKIYIYHENFSHEKIMSPACCHRSPPTVWQALSWSHYNMRGCGRAVGEKEKQTTCAASGEAELETRVDGNSLIK